MSTHAGRLVAALFDDDPDAFELTIERAGEYADGDVAYVVQDAYDRLHGHPDEVARLVEWLGPARARFYGVRP